MRSFSLPAMFFSLVPFLVSPAIAYQGELAVPAIQNRATPVYNGGWALGLANEICPAEAPVQCGNANCCPPGQTCHGIGAYYCCPTSADCGTVVVNFPVCANSSWDMYTMKNGYWICCEPGTVGITPTQSGSGMCEPPDVVQAALLATPTAQYSGGPAATSSGAGAQNTAVTSVKGGSTPTTKAGITSTDANGGVNVDTTQSAGVGSGSSTTGSNSSSPILTLSLGAIVGIAVVGSGALLTVLALIWLCCRRRSRKRNFQNHPTSAPMNVAAAPVYASIPSPGPKYSAMSEGGNFQMPSNGRLGTPTYSPVLMQYNEYQRPVTQSELEHTVRTPQMSEIE
ncbi:hypothetical protein G7Y89_g6065 [Cudoniella acicularis]|uniref:Uncharacterized protein n=1 Tax=Cudoniella acicularis TaxID=354080 RepID=A0A8H4RM17_9HELO|nr:hypothetical protein G7Y89_g6065 [Cudoniella acicularis]